MKIGKPVGLWMAENGVLDPTSVINDQPLPDHVFKEIEYGLNLESLVNSLRKHNGSQNHFRGIKHEHTASAKASNWSLIEEALKSVGFSLSASSKSKIMSGNKQEILHLLDAIHDAFIKNQNQKSFNSTCLETLMKLLTRHLKIKPPHALALLAQGNKLLAHVVVKGFKHEFTPILNWYKAIGHEFKHIMEQVIKEKSLGSVHMILSVIRPGLISKDTAVLQEALMLMQRAINKLKHAGLDKEINGWAHQDGIDICYWSLLRDPHHACEGIARILAEFPEREMKDIIGKSFSHIAKSKGEYMTVLSSLYDGFLRKEEMLSYLYPMFIEKCLLNFEDSRLVCATMLASLWDHYQYELKGDHKTSSLILNALQKASRDSSMICKFSVISDQFRLLSSFYAQKNEYAPIMYKNLCFSFIEQINIEEIRELFIYNFLPLLDTIESLPIGTLIDSFSKLNRDSSINWNTFDFELFLQLARHSRLNLNSAVKLIDILLKVHMNQVVFSKAARIPLILASKRFISNDLMKQFLVRVVKILLNSLFATENSRKKSAISLALRRKSLIDLSREIIKLNPNDEYAQLVLSANNAYKANSQSDDPDLLSLLDLIGNSQQMLKTFESSLDLFVHYEITDKAPSFSVTQDIEMTRKKRLAGLEMKKKQEELAKSKTERMLKKSKDVINRRKVELGLKASSAIIDSNIEVTEEGCELYPLENEPKEEREMFKRAIKRYTRGLKFYYYHYQKLKQQKRNFDEHVFDDTFKRQNCIDSVQILNMLRSLGIDSSLLKRPELFWFCKECAHSNIIEWDGFIQILSQVSVWIFRNDPSLNNLPLVYSFLRMISIFKDKENNKSLFDEPDPGYGDCAVARYINKHLIEDPEFPLPTNYVIVNDYELKISHELPEFIPENIRIAKEMASEICFKALGFHLTGATSQVEKYSRVKGTSKIKHIPMHLKASDCIKYNVAMLAEDFRMDLLVETARVLDDAIHAVEKGNVNKPLHYYKERKDNDNHDKEEDWSKRASELKGKLKKLQEEKEEKDKETKANAEKLKAKEIEKEKRKQMAKMEKLKNDKMVVENWKKEQEQMKAQENKTKLEHEKVAKEKHMKEINERIKKSTKNMQEKFREISGKRKQD